MNPNIKCLCPFGNPSIGVAENCPIHGIQLQGNGAGEAAKERYKAGEQMIWRDPKNLPKGMSGYIETYTLTREAFVAGANWQASLNQNESGQAEEIRKVVEQIFYSPATNGKAEESIQNGIELVKKLLAPSPQTSGAVWEEQDVKNIINMVCDQFDAGFVGRDEFVIRTIEEYKKRPESASSPGEREIDELKKNNIKIHDKLQQALGRGVKDYEEIERLKGLVLKMYEELEAANGIDSSPAVGASRLQQFKKNNNL